MKTTKSLFIILTILMVGSCQINEEEEPELLLSKIDGEEYVSTMNGEMSAEKAILLIDQNLIDSLTQPDFMLLAQGLNHTDSVIRDNCFNALSTTYMYIIPNNYPILEGMIFAKLVSYPIESIFQLQQTATDVHHFWMERLFTEYSRQTAAPEVTKISVINILLKNCKNCSLEDQEDIAAFVDYMELFTSN